MRTVSMSSTDNVWELYNASATLISSWLPQNGIEWGWCISFGPPALCLVGIHIIFRNIFTIMWFSVKVVIAGIVYMHIKTLVSSAVLPYSFESVVFGIPPGTLQAPLDVAFQIFCAKSLLVVSSICPRCFPTPIPPIPPRPKTPSRSPWVDWIGGHNGL